MTVRTHRLALALLAGLATTTLHAADVVDDFEDGRNDGVWRIILGGDIMETKGGNPGGWLHNDVLDSFAPIVKCADANAFFTGDLRTMGVNGYSFDARTDFSTFGHAGFEMSIVLRDTKGTPEVDDDDFAYYVGPETPQPGEGWVHYDFDVPSQSNDALPAGWHGGWVGDVENFRPGVDWNDVVTSVDRVEFWWINPAYFAILQRWDLGVDNITASVDASCPEDLDDSGAVDFGDILAVLAAWDNAGGPEDLDGSGTVDFGDILAVLAVWGPCV